MTLSNYRPYCVGLAVALTVQVLPQELEWLSHYGNGHPMNGGFRLAAGSNGATYCAGTAATPEVEFNSETVGISGYSDAVLVKLDATGTAVWASNGGGACGSQLDTEVAEVVEHDPNSGHTVIAGIYMTSASFGQFSLPAGSCLEGYNMFLAAYDDLGECSWAEYATGYAVRPDKILIRDSEVHLFSESLLGSVHFSGSPEFVQGSAFVSHYDVDGALLAVDRTMRNGHINDAAWLGDDWIVCGMTMGIDSLWETALHAGQPGTDGFVARTSVPGQVDWVQRMRSDSAVIVQYADITPSGLIVVSGVYWEDLFFDTDTLDGSSAMSGFIAIFSDTGELLWATPLIDDTFVNLRDQKVGPDGSIYILGSFSGELQVDGHAFHANSSRQSYLLRFDGDLGCDAALYFGRTQPTSPGGLLVNADGVYMSANYDSTFSIAGIEVPVTIPNNPDFFVAKFDSISGFTGVQPLSGGPETLVIYANPSDGICTVELPASIAPGDELVLTIFDAVGKAVQQAPLIIDDGRILLDIRAEAKGLYHLELNNGRRRYTGKIIFE